MCHMIFRLYLDLNKEWIIQFKNKTRTFYPKKEKWRRKTGFQSFKKECSNFLKSAIRVPQQKVELVFNQPPILIELVKGQVFRNSFGSSNLPKARAYCVISWLRKNCEIYSIHRIIRGRKRPNFSKFASRVCAERRTWKVNRWSRATAKAASPHFVPLSLYKRRAKKVRGTQNFGAPCRRAEFDENAPKNCFGERVRGRKSQKKSL